MSQVSVCLMCMVLKCPRPPDLNIVYWTRFETPGAVEQFLHHLGALRWRASIHTSFTAILKSGEGGGQTKSRVP